MHPKAEASPLHPTSCAAAGEYHPLCLSLGLHTPHIEPEKRLCADELLGMPVLGDSMVDPKSVLGCCIHDCPLVQAGIRLLEPVEGLRISL